MSSPATRPPAPRHVHHDLVVLAALALGVIAVVLAVGWAADHASARTDGAEAARHAGPTEPEEPDPWPRPNPTTTTTTAPPVTAPPVTAPPTTAPPPPPAPPVTAAPAPARAAARAPAPAPPPPPPTTAPPPPVLDGAAESAILAAINDARAQNGLAPLARAGRDDLAQAHALRMAQQRRIFHSGAGCPETVGYTGGGGGGGTIVAMWMASGSHRAILLDPAATVVGIGAARTSDGYLYAAALTC